jgi:hypothetical protein
MSKPLPLALLSVILLACGPAAQLGLDINGYSLSGAQPLAKFKKVVRRALAEAK